MVINRAVLIMCLLTAFAMPVSASPPSEPIPMPGYLILPPKGDQWDREITQEQALFFRRLDQERARLGLEEFQSVVLIASSSVVGEVPYEDPSQLLELFKAKLQGESPDIQLESIAITKEVKTSFGPALCADYQIKGKQKDNVSGQPDKFFILTIRGRSCLHPTFPIYVIDLAYSQRSYKGQWVTAFDEEVTDFFKLDFRSVDLGPYVAEVLRAYATSLAASGKQDEAETIKQRAAKLDEPNVGSSRYLGFNPETELTNYAEHLRSKGDEVSAKRISILARNWTHNQLLAVDELRRNLVPQ